MALDMFINLGNMIVGETLDKVQGKNGDIDVLAWGWGMTQSGTTHLGRGGGAGKANFQDLSFTKYVDTASVGIMTALAKGSHIPVATLLVRKAGEGHVNYILIRLTEVMVTSLTTGGSGGEDRLTEIVTLNFAQVKYSYFPQNVKASAESSKPFAWDIAGNVGLVS